MLDIFQHYSPSRLFEVRRPPFHLEALRIDPPLATAPMPGSPGTLTGDRDNTMNLTESLLLLDFGSYIDVMGFLLNLSIISVCSALVLVVGTVSFSYIQRGCSVTDLFPLL